MRKAQWVQPQLDHGAIQAARISLDWIYGVGWVGSCSIRQEGSFSRSFVEVSALVEGDAEALEAWLKLVSSFLGSY